MSACTIRRATAQDAEAIGSLIAEFQAYLRSLGDPTQFAFGAAEYLRDGFGRQPAFECSVAVADARVVGYLLHHPGYDTDYGQRLVYIVDLYVQEAARRRGIGRALMHHAVEVALAQSAQALLWSVHRHNLLGMHFYERLGAMYIEGQHFMKLDIGDMADRLPGIGPDQAPVLES
jgi:GNAT superfamily N-acetyltransferase